MKPLLSAALAATLPLACCTSPDAAVTAAPDAPPPIAIAAGQPIRLADLTPSLLETAGSVALEEAILGAGLADRCTRAGLTIGPNEIRAERDVLVESLGARADDGEALLTQFRAQRGLGETRFAGLLRRNAMLRALAGQPTPSAEQLRLLEEASFGPKVRLQLLVVPDERQAARLRSELGARPTAQDVTAAAAASSIDDTASSGGWLGPVSPIDPRIDESVRRALGAIGVGELSHPIPLRRGVALVRLDERLPARQPTDDERGALARQLAMQLQRERMDAIANAVLAEARPIITDRRLHWSWQQRAR